MGIDLLLLQEDKGGDLKSVLASEKALFAPEGLVPEVLELYKAWTKGKQHNLSLNSDRDGFIPGREGWTGLARTRTTTSQPRSQRLTLSSWAHSPV
jgi:hypothetical protein